MNKNNKILEQSLYGKLFRENTEPRFKASFNELTSEEIEYFTNKISSSLVNDIYENSIINKKDIETSKKIMDNINVKMYNYISNHISNIINENKHIPYDLILIFNNCWKLFNFESKYYFKDRLNIISAIYSNNIDNNINCYIKFKAIYKNKTYNFSTTFSDNTKSFLIVKDTDNIIEEVFDNESMLFKSEFYSNLKKAIKVSVNLVFN
jgi:hypothetical protein